MSDDIQKETERIHEGIVASLSFSEALAKRDAEIERLRGLVDACSIFLKEDETPAQRIERERADTEAVLKLLLKEKRDNERLRGLLREVGNQHRQLAGLLRGAQVPLEPMMRWMPSSDASTRR